MHFPRIRLLEQTEHKFRRFESVVKKRVTDSRALLLKNWTDQCEICGLKKKKPL